MPKTRMALNGLALTILMKGVDVPPCRNEECRMAWALSSRTGGLFLASHVSHIPHIVGFRVGKEHSLD